MIKLFEVIFSRLYPKEDISSTASRNAFVSSSHASSTTSILVRLKLSTLKEISENPHNTKQDFKTISFPTLNPRPIIFTSSTNLFSSSLASFSCHWAVANESNKSECLCRPHPGSAYTRNPNYQICSRSPLKQGNL